MPIYEYKCTKCGKVFSKLQFNTDEPVECPSCKSTDVERQISTLGGIGGGTASSGSCGSGSGFR